MEPKELAHKRSSTLGQTCSDIMRRGLQPHPTGPIRNGVHVFPAGHGAKRTTMELVNRFRDDE